MRTIPRPLPHALLLALTVTALGAASLAGQTLDRAKRPAATAQPPLKLPPIEVRNLRNGIAVAVMRDARLPVVSVGAVLDIPDAVDPVDKVGLGDLTETMLRE